MYKTSSFKIQKCKHSENKEVTGYKLIYNTTLLKNIRKRLHLIYIRTIAPECMSC